MIETLLQQRYYVAAVVLFSIGFVTLFLHPNLIKKIIGMNLMDTAVFLFLAAMGYVDGGRPPWWSRERRRRPTSTRCPAGWCSRASWWR